MTNLRIRRLVNARAGAMIAAAIVLGSCASSSRPPALRQFEFDPSAPSELVVDRSPAGQLLVEGVVEGRAGWFIFDTGAGGNVIDQGLATELALETKGSRKVEGTATIKHSPTYLVRTLRLGPTSARDALFTGVDLSFASQAWNIKILGIIGFPILERATVELCFDPPRVALFDPGQYRPNDTPWRAATLDNGQLLVPATFNGHHGLFRLDTGATWNGIIHTPSVERFGLLEGQETESASTAGVGGDAGFELGRLESLDVWAQRYEDLPFCFSTASTGAFASDSVTGNIGAGLLGTRTLILDYRFNRYAIVP